VRSTYRTSSGTFSNPTMSDTSTPHPDAADSPAVANRAGLLISVETGE
jgi:hypothetical protein